MDSKIFTGFCFGVLASVSVVLLVFFILPSKYPSISPVSRQKHYYTPNSTRLAWPFPFANLTPTNFTLTHHHANANSSEHLRFDNIFLSNSVHRPATWEKSEKNDSQGYNGECDMFDGNWVRDEHTKPYYPPGSCPFIDPSFNCKLNRRPDDGFLEWKWQPNACQIPRLNATDFLERLRGKKLVFVGDSLNRNMWESLVCILRHSIKNKKNVFEISGRREFKKKDIYAFKFQDYNCSVDFVTSVFLVRESSYKTGNISLETLRLDRMDRTTSKYHDADVIVFNTGHWWTHDKTVKFGTGPTRSNNITDIVPDLTTYHTEHKHVYPRLDVHEAYKKALKTWARWIDKNIDRTKTQVIFRGYSATHFRGGQWNSGGECDKETEPIFNTSYLVKYPAKMMILETIFGEMKTPIIYLNISRLTDYRKDGHPSIYRPAKTITDHTQDCSHWCLPGVPDTWNELLYASLLKVGKGPWKT